MEYKLKDIGKVVTGCTPKTKNEEYYSGKDYLFIGPTDMKSCKYVRKTEKYISNTAYRDYSSRFINKNSIMVDCIGSDMGNVALSADEVLTNQQINSIAEIDKNKFNVEYVYYVLSTMKKYFHQIGTNGSTMPIINKTMFEEIEIEVPEKNIQDKVVSILSKIDKKIELNNQINDNLQKLVNTVFAKWFCEYDYPNEEDQPYKSSGGIMIESELGEIPNNWKIGNFQDIIDFSNGYVFKSSDLLDNEEKETYKVFKQGNINLSGGINEEKTKSWFYKDKAKGLEKFILKKGDILMCMTDMKNSTSPLLGHTALMNVDDEYIVNQRVGLIRCKKEITDYPYVYTMSNLEYFLKDIRSRANSGVQVNLSINGICETKIVIPSKMILDKFNNFAKPLYEIMFNNQKENRVLEQIRNTLLPKLINGEIDLENIEI